MRKRELNLENNGYTFHSYEYDYDAQREMRILERRGFECKLLRERTDTKGLKMYSVWYK